MPSGFSFLFPAGSRPRADAVAQVAARAAGLPGFAISHAPAGDQGWLEVIQTGLTFDLTGLAPGKPAPAPRIAHRFGLAADASLVGEAVALAPTVHLAGGERMLPVVRAGAAIAAALAALDGIVAVCWEPARSAMAPAIFIAAIRGWLGGGAFPALGLAALARNAQGAIESEGLAFFTGQELTIAPGTCDSPREEARLATRLIHQLVESGRLDDAIDIGGVDGERLRIAPQGDKTMLMVCRPR
ncbi:MAG: hypothetical protein KGK11_06180 [Sphingomonadales bacterium]|nr:hypothetical protein [Sphingomonadales bacterium]